MREDGRIDYIEFPGADLPTTKGFYERAFGWTFTDYGPAYAAFDNGGVDGGINADSADRCAAPLVILFAADLEAMLARVLDAGGSLTRPIFSFPGGRRFHFRDPSGNELAVFSEG
jgi:predicted enzyme related to lactoylglutathione lyase